jgi:hypothetical protein
MKKRERILVIATVGVLALLVLDRVAFSPYLEARDQLVQKEARLLDDLREVNRTLQTRKHVAQQWHAMLDTGLKDTPSQAESRVLHAVRQWATEARLELTAVNLERSEALTTPGGAGKDGGELRQVTFHAAGIGKMQAVSRFLYGAETSTMPLKVMNVQLSSRSPGKDDLALDVRLSTLLLAPQQNGGSTK